MAGRRGGKSRGSTRRTRSILAACVAASLLVGAMDGVEQDGARAAGFAPVGIPPGWSTDPIRTEDLLVIDERPKAKLKVEIEPGPRIHCQVACTATAKVKLDLPGKDDPEPRQFTSDLPKGDIFRAFITLTKPTLRRLRRNAARSRLIVDIEAREITDGSTAGRSDRDFRVFIFRTGS